MRTSRSNRASAGRQSRRPQSNQVKFWVLCAVLGTVFAASVASAYEVRGGGSGRGIVETRDLRGGGRGVIGVDRDDPNRFGRKIGVDWYDPDQQVGPRKIGVDWALGRGFMLPLIRKTLAR